MAGTIFRKVALERLSTPEQLDQTMRVMSPFGWLALSSVGALILTALVWSLVGTAPIKVKGYGILLAPGGVFDVVSTSQGRLRSYLVRPGDAVQAGQPVVIVEQPEIIQSLASAKSAMAELQRQREIILAFQVKDHRAQHDLRARQKSDLLQSVNSQQERLRWLEERSVGEDSLHQKGYLSRQKYLETKAEIAKVRDDVAQSRSKMQQLDAGATSALLESEREVLNLDLQIAAAQRAINDLDERLERDSRIVSPYSGTVVEMKVSAGEVVTPGLPLFALLPPQPAGTAGTGGDLMGVFYVSPDQGKKVQPGMAVQLAPDTVRREEYGTMEARVVSVATIPSTEEGMVQTLKNKVLAQALSKGGSPFEVRVELKRDPGSASGYKWTSRGPDHPISTGTLAEADVTIKRMRLITLVIPALTQLLKVEDGL